MSLFVTIILFHLQHAIQDSQKYTRRHTLTQEQTYKNRRAQERAYTRIDVHKNIRVHKKRRTQ